MMLCVSTFSRASSRCVAIERPPTAPPRLLDHAHDRLDLPTLAVADVAVALLPPAVRPCGRLGARPADPGRDDAAHAAPVAREAVVRLAVAAGVAEDRADAAHAGQRREQQPPERVHVDARPA